MIRNKNNSQPSFSSSGENPYFIKEINKISEKRALELAKDLFLVAKRRTRNLILEANITNRSNSNFKKNKEKNISVSLFEKLIKEMKKYGFRLIFFIGGEPILHPEFETLIRLAGDYGYYYRVAIKDEFLYQKYWLIIEKYRKFCSAINLNLEGATAEVHESVRNKKDSFKKIIEAIKFYIENKIPVTITASLNKKNWHQIKEITLLCQSLGVRILKYTTLLEAIEGENYVLSEEEKEKCIEQIREINRTKEFSLKIFINPKFLVDSPKTINFCKDLVALRRLSVDYDGGMLFCGGIYKQCKNKPTILKEKILNGLRDNITIINEIKKQRLKDLSREIYFKGFDTCQYCNKYIEEIIKKIRKNEN